jgi:hypothetical protein
MNKIFQQGPRYLVVILGASKRRISQMPYPSLNDTEVEYLSMNSSALNRNQKTPSLFD